MNRKERRAQKDGARPASQASAAVPSKSNARQNAQQLFTEAVGLHRAGHLDQAIAVYTQLLKLNAHLAEAHNNLGVALQARGRLDEAEAAFRRAAACERDYAGAHCNLGNVLLAKGKPLDAETAYRRALSLKPDMHDAHGNLGQALQAQGLLDAAIDSYTRAIALKPSYAEAHCNLGVVLSEQDKLDVAVASFRRALAHMPRYAEAHCNLGNALRDLGQVEEAVLCYVRALDVQPHYAQAMSNLAMALQDQGKTAEALTMYRKAATLSPNDAIVRVNLALAQLLTGDFVSGWHEYEWRWQRPDNVVQHFDQPQWDGSALAGRSIFLHAEQGFGDTFQFVRYAAVLRRHARAVFVQCQPELVRVLRGMPGVDGVIPRGEALPAFDCHAPLLSLPKLCGTDLAGIPAHIPYLAVPSEDVEMWRARGVLRPGMNVGVFWRGNQKTLDQRKRSIPIEALAPLAGVPGLNWISLQPDATPDELAAFASYGGIQDHGALLKDWADTAALIATLDLVVTVDSAVAHLAGALGKPTWVLLRYVPHWTWLLERDDSPWYPRARLFRQPQRDDWTPVLSAVRTALEQTVSAAA